MAQSLPMTSQPPAKRFDWSNLGLRVASAGVMVPAALAAAWFGGPFWLVAVAIGVALLALEWGDMSAPLAPTRVSAAVGVAVLTAVFLAYLDEPRLAWAAIGVGAVAAALVARGVAERPADAAFGVIYIAPAAVCLIWLRDSNDVRSTQGHWWMMMLFACTWAADIGAFAVGSALKGPKLWPRFSPNKTWSGFVGGLAAAMAVGALMASLPAFQLNPIAAALVGLSVGVATMAGDLWESALKRRFGVKDSGDLIPGHGGLLDRVDGLMFAVVVMAVVRLVNLVGWH
jgi:phosphatidate cytidylyltransferase